MARREVLVQLDDELVDRSRGRSRSRAAHPSVINCDNLITVPKRVLDEPVGHLDSRARALLDQALHYALDIQY